MELNGVTGRETFLRSTRDRLLLILGLALILRLALFALTLQGNRIITGSPDSQRYLTTAISLANTHSFTLAGHPETRQTPGYPLFLALCGVRNQHTYQVAQFIQVFLDVLLVFLTFRIAARLFGPQSALWSAFLQAVSALAVFSSVSIATDTLFALDVGLIMWLYASRIQYGARFAVTVALLTAVATWIRPVGFFLVPAQLVVLCLLPGRVRRVGIFVLAFAAGVSPWYIRNQVLLGYQGFSSQSEYNFMNYEATSVLARASRISPERARTKINQLFREEASRLKIADNTAAAFALQRKIAANVIRSAPMDFVIGHLKDSLITLLPDITGILHTSGITTGGGGTLSLTQEKGLLAGIQYYFRKNMLAILLVVPEASLLLLSYLGLSFWAFTARRNLRPPDLLILLLIPTFVFLGGSGSVPRYRLPVEALVHVCAGAGLMRLPGWRKDPIPQSD